MRCLPQIVVLIALLIPNAGCKKTGDMGQNPSAETTNGTTADSPATFDPNHVRETTPQELYDRIVAGQKTHLIDVREPAEFAGGSIRGAILMPRGTIQNTIEEVAPDKEARIDLFCAAGRRSAIATKTLQKMGYTQVYSLEGGFKAWTTQNRKLPIAPVAGPSPEEQTESPPSEKTEENNPKPVEKANEPDTVQEPTEVPAIESDASETNEELPAKEEDASPEEKKEEKPKPVGPDGLKEEKATEAMLPGFPPKDTKPTGPDNMEEEFVDPRLAPDSAVIFDKNKLPLGHETQGNSNEISTIPSALIFPFVKGQAGGNQKLRIHALKDTSIESMSLQEPKGPFRISPAAQKGVLKQGEGFVLTVECDVSDEPHQTTLLIHTKTQTERIPLKLEIASP